MCSQFNERRSHRLVAQSVCTSPNKEFVLGLPSWWTKKNVRVPPLGDRPNDPSVAPTQRGTPEWKDPKIRRQCSPTSRRVQCGRSIVPNTPSEMPNTWGKQCLEPPLKTRGGPRGCQLSEDNKSNEKLSLIGPVR